MAEEIISIQPSATTPNPETPSSSVDYGEIIRSVRVSELTDESVEETAGPQRPSAEDEVCAILLSAMMGSVVKSWKSKTSSDIKHFSTYSIAKESSGERSTVHRTHLSAMSRVKAHASAVFSDSQPRRKTQETTESPTRGTAISLFGTTENTEEVDRSQNYESVQKSSGFSQPQSYSKESNNSSINLCKLKELLYSEKEKIFGWDFLEYEQEVVITFNQGNRFEGKLINCRMHGKGKFYWADGSSYEGNFFHGQMTGQGKLQWPDGSWYEGEFRRGYRHGRGLYVERPTFYAGYWKCGHRHGLGAMYYNHFDTKKDYYNGEWFADQKHGTGLRSYPSGAMYSGQWNSGKRCGLGTMVWTNHDVYSGNFRKGKMHGYGEYTWDTFFNQQMVVPEENCYYGNWEKNLRHGNGTLETTSGVVVKGSWKSGKKHGPAEVICSNGSFLYDDNLFEEDSLQLPDSSVEIDSLMNTSLQSLYRLPINAASHEINLHYYVDRLIELINESYAFGNPLCQKLLDSHIRIDSKRTFSFNYSSEPKENKLDYQEEENYIRNIILQFMSSLKTIYTTYSQICCDAKPTFSTVLTRLMWWQLLRDCNLHARGFSLAHFDICIANNKASLVQGVHYPFERLLFWQFLHCLIEVSWELYTKKCIGTPSVKGIIASGLHKLITADIIPNVGKHKGSALFRCRNVISFDSVYWCFRGAGEPHSARQFLKYALTQQETSGDRDTEPVTFREYQTRGENIFGVGGKLTYFPKEEPLVADREYQYQANHPKNLSCLSSIGLMGLLNCIIKICPSVSKNGQLVNMDYKLIFLEFYEIFLLCAREKARLKILERKQQEMELENKIPATVSPSNTAPEESPMLDEEVVPPPEKSSQRKKSSGTKKPKKKAK